MSDKVMTKATRAGLQGERGLVAAKLGLSVDDAAGRNGREHVLDARRYLQSRDYRHDIEALGLPGEWLPQEIDNENKQTR